ncbi:TetR/AcrR family transcriptional regulator [Streptomyces sp. G-G2]|uniref:TetR/AcrR family transcriptional regulator n=1 Tax=Streptomyces sp. G-G2 TaxID=3046201 RepID=UPI0024BB5A19|nr:TetR/AcrR family transcriptional regulator [Streptomyces sp. G-G2]MDJ0386253.1 TetR/AcrR family transcriptional regulator [Streptomyces sp. G-G2]
MARTERARFTAQDWIDTAISAMARGGVRAVAVEPLAAELGASKGGFYWFFANRDALVAAALRHWCDTTTRQAVDALAALPDPRAKLSALLKTAFESPNRGIEIALQADAARDPGVREILAETHRRRLEILRHLLTEGGRDPVEAESTALSLYAVHLGLLHLRSAAPDLATPQADHPSYHQSLLARLMDRPE